MGEGIRVAAADVETAEKSPVARGRVMAPWQSDEPAHRCIRVTQQTMCLHSERSLHHPYSLYTGHSAQPPAFVHERRYRLARAFATSPMTPSPATSLTVSTTPNSMPLSRSKESTTSW